MILSQALIPSFIWGVYVFGMRAFSIVVISVLASVGFEVLYQVLMKKRITVSDCSAAVTGLLLGMNLPATVPLWLPIIGAFFAIVIVKQLYGGIGKNFMNPALAARAFLMLAWPTEMTTTPAPLTSSSAFAVSIESADIVASATPMQLLKNGTIPDGGMFNFLLGSKAGTIGEVSTLLLIAGGIYLLVRRVISWHTPVAYIGTVALIAYLFPQNAAARTEFVAYELICGGDARRHLHGNGLRDHAHHRKGTSDLRCRMRLYHHVYPLLRRLSGGHHVLDFDYEHARLVH